jgi:hypothetical protein
MRVLLVSSWGTACGIADYAAQLKAAVEGADPGIEVCPDPEGLDPAVVQQRLEWGSRWDLVHLNFHLALHSRWEAEHVAAVTAQGVPVIVTFHDTRERLADCPKLAALAQVASSTIVHEPVEGLKAIYWRQGVPAAAQDPFTYRSAYAESSPAQTQWGRDFEHEVTFKRYPQQPVLGTVGFHFPWKNYDRLAQLTGEEDWALVILSNNATEEDEARWRALNSSVLVVREFLPVQACVNYLAGCDATAFMYECSNTGTSGAIRLGIAARKPVFALYGCRQFRDLHAEGAIDWVNDWQDLRNMMGYDPTMRYDPELIRLAHHDSWVQRGTDHAALYRALVEGTPL